MKLMETGNEKVKKICEVLRRETIEPARQQADDLLHSARAEADRLIKQAHEKAASIVHEAEDRMRKQEEVFKASLNLSFKQAITKLKNDVQKSLFIPALKEKVERELSDQTMIHKLLNALVEGMRNSGIDTDVTLILSKTINQDALANFIAHSGFANKKDKVLAIGDFQSGFQLKIEKEHLTVELTEETLLQLILDYTSENFRKLVFNI